MNTKGKIALGSLAAIIIIVILIISLTPKKSDTPRITSDDTDISTDTVDEQCWPSIDLYHTSKTLCLDYEGWALAEQTYLEPSVGDFVVGDTNTAGYKFYQHDGEGNELYGQESETIFLHGPDYRGCADLGPAATCNETHGLYTKSKNDQVIKVYNDILAQLEMLDITESYPRELPAFLEQDFINFYVRYFQESIRTDDAAALAALMNGKMLFNGETFEDPDKQLSPRDYFLQEYENIFTEDLKQVIRAQRLHDVFINDQGIMIGNGEIWFESEPVGAGLYLIKSINQIDY